MARKEADKRCLTCSSLSTCRTVTSEMLERGESCALWKLNDELAIDAREEIEIEFGSAALAMLALRKGQAPPYKKGRKHVRRRTRKATP